jgi:hypothetical protein
MNENELFDAVKDAIIDVELGRVHIVDGVDTIMALVTPQWTPVTPETMPPLKTEVLATDGEHIDKAACEGWDGWYVTSGGDDWRDYYEASVTHWMPLPRRPEGVSE